jgi:catechol 2,3-dioxygenase-like lactoylglutathione lyase family enzyme
MPSAAPIFTVRDIPATADFYKNVLGATGQGAFPPGPWGYVTHGEVDLYGLKLMFTPDEGPPATTDLPWRVRAKASQEPRGTGIAVGVDLDAGADIDGLCERIRGLGGKIASEPRDHSWGVRLFVVEDPDGYMVYFNKRVPRD